jgi:hypothetical protein
MNAIDAAGARGERAAGEAGHDHVVEGTGRRSAGGIDAGEIAIVRNGLAAATVLGFTSNLVKDRPIPIRRWRSRAGDHDRRRRPTGRERTR